MTTLNCQVTYRPLRVGWCVCSNSLDEVREAMRLAYCFWGGVLGPILPADSSESAARLASLFRVDALVSVSSDPDVEAFVKSQGHLPWPAIGGEKLFTEWSRGRLEPNLLDVRHPAREIEEWRAAKRLSPAFFSVLPSWNDDDDPLAPAFLAMFGGYPDRATAGRDYGQMVVQRATAKNVELDPALPIPDDLYRTSIPYYLSFHQLRLNPPRSPREPGVYLGAATSPRDLIDYWNLRAADVPRLLFVDMRYWERLRALIQHFAGDIASTWASPPEPHRRFAIWSSGDLAPEPPTMDLGRALPLVNCTVSEATWNGLNVRPGIPVFDSHFTMAAVTEEYGRLVAHVPLARKPFREDRGPVERQAMVASVRATGLPPDQEQLTFCPPFVPQLNEYYGRNLHYLWNVARAEPDSIGIVTNVGEHHIRLAGLLHDEVIARIFDACGIDASPSLPGRVCRRLIRQMGGLQGCRPFKIRGVRELIRAYPATKSFSKSAAMQKIGSVSEGSPHFSDFEDLFIEPRARGKLKPIDVFTYMLRKKIFRAGLELNCSHCELRSWISIDDLRSDCRCEYCGQTFDVTPQLKDRDWAFRGSGLFGRDDNQEGAIPVALALQQLDANLWDSEAVYSTGMELRWKRGGRRPAEVDLVYVMNRPAERPAILVGECKDHGEIEDQDVLNLRDVAATLEKLDVEVYILFAKASPFTAAEVESCKAAQPEDKERVIMLGDRELEPHRIPDRIKAVPAPLKYRSDLRWLAQLTTHAYFRGGNTAS